MDDLISRQKVIDATWFEPSYTDPLNVLTEVRDRLKALPSAQPEIIRCKDCKWKNNHNCTRAVEVWIDDNKYCAWAERRTDEV